MKILVINPGGTSTKVSVFEDKDELFKLSLSHTAEDLKDFHTVFDEFEFRKNIVLTALKDKGLSIKDFGCVVGRGGLLKEIQGGTYHVNHIMIDDVKNAIRGEHASNLGCVLAKSIADEVNIPSFIVDPVSVDEFEDMSKITGISDLTYPSWLHSLNHKAVCRLMAKRMGGKYSDFNFIVAHLGSGISVVPHKKGKMVDGSGGRCNGPFSPERSGGLPAYPLIQLCYSGKYTYKEMVSKVSSIGGMYDYLGTKDTREIEERINNGDEKAKLVMDAFIYQVSKEIAQYGATLCGKVDKIILTGGIANSKLITEAVKERVGYLAPVEIIAGEAEMEALALGALRVLNGEEEAKEYK
ncbi:MAG: butyrate kinase [Anaeromicrobium sp.]|uniref:butyrate kinase n=1 Tax=Anaeromicrobium sp. TaxID=1929132 RepID=UPI0025EA0027|nr:butyrate kinase [Anaeromicrobium sp.]MCT4593417.1 butyrate kinase [Anaeromicrobium sp.]